MNKSSFLSFAPVALRWLEWQCKMVSDVKIGIIFIKEESDADLTQLAIWPTSHANEVDTELQKIANNAFAGKENFSPKITYSIDGINSVYDVITLPLRYDEEIVGSVLFLQSVRSDEQKKAINQLFMWGVSWLETTLTATIDEKNQLNSLVTSLAKIALQDAPLALTAHDVCNLLSKELECSRVSIGLMKGLQVNTLALSEQLRFDARSSNIRAIESAMEEAIDQQEIIAYPQKDEKLSVVTHKHHTLSKMNDLDSVLCLPFELEKDSFGALMLIREKNRPFTKEEIAILKYSVEILGPVIGLKLHEERSLLTVFYHSMRKKLLYFFSKESLLLKISSIVFVILFAVLSFVKTDYYIFAASSLEGAIVQVILSPQDSFIQKAELRAGDLVKKDDILVEVDDRDVKLENEKLLSERGKILKEYQESLALRERAKMSILLARVTQVDARLEVVKEKLKRISIKAPFSGVIVSGDLSHSFGAPVEKGKQLFELSPQGDYRVVLSVDDHDVSKLEVGQVGTLRLVGLPYDQLSIEVSKITPIAVPQNGGNYFRVEATILTPDDNKLRPGMQGVAKIQISQESVIWVWTHTILERVRLWLWSIGL